MYIYIYTYIYTHTHTHICEARRGEGGLPRPRVPAARGDPGALRYTILVMLST